eukprot:4746246-Prymnesium_polylepis.1
MHSHSTLHQEERNKIGGVHDELEGFHPQLKFEPRKIVADSRRRFSFRRRTLMQRRIHDPGSIGPTFATCRHAQGCISCSGPTAWDCTTRSGMTSLA